MELKIKFLKWSAGIPVAMIHKKTAAEIGIHSGDRISIKPVDKNPKAIYTIVDTVEKIIKRNEIGLSFEIKKTEHLKNGERADVNFSPSSKSLSFIKKKLEGKELSQGEINEIIFDVVDNSLSEAEIALFISAMYQKGMNMRETIFLIKAILGKGNLMKFKGKFVVDKHSIGGVAGNRTTPIVVSICAAAGLTMPKNSSRAITSASGTADTVESIARVEFTTKEIKKIVAKTNACMVWGGANEMVPADAKINITEKVLKIDPEAQLLASIMSKKLAAGAKYILIDIPYGKTAKISRKGGLALKRKFEYLGKYFKKILKCVLTDGSQPIGNGIGPMLEMADIVNILDPAKKGPGDLEQKSLMLAGEIFEMTGKAKKSKGISMARNLLYSGKAFEKFKEIIKAQEGNINRIHKAKFKKDIYAQKTGTIRVIDNGRVNFLARAAGCPVDKAAGVYLYHHVNDRIKKGEKIMTLYAETHPRLAQAIAFYKMRQPIFIR